MPPPPVAELPESAVRNGQRAVVEDAAADVCAVAGEVLFVNGQDGRQS